VILLRPNVLHVLADACVLLSESNRMDRIVELGFGTTSGIEAALLPALIDG